VINIRAQILCIKYKTYENAGWVKLVKEDEGLRGEFPSVVEEPAIRQESLQVYSQ
jgi:hypothetical protein